MGMGALWRAVKGPVGVPVRMETVTLMAALTPQRGDVEAGSCIPKANRWCPELSAVHCARTPLALVGPGWSAP